MDAAEAQLRLQNDSRLGHVKVQKIAEGEKYVGSIFEIVLIRFDPQTNKATRVGPAWMLRDYLD